MSDYVGREFKLGITDCYTLVRDYYRNEYGMILPNYARPDGFWEHDMDLYVPRYQREGFKPVDGPTQAGDLILMAINSAHANHAAIVLPNGNILHHLIYRLSVEEPYRALWRNMTVGVIRHPDVPTQGREEQLLDIRDALSRRKQEQIDAASQA